MSGHEGFYGCDWLKTYDLEFLGAQVNPMVVLLALICPYCTTRTARWTTISSSTRQTNESLKSKRTTDSRGTRSTLNTHSSQINALRMQIRLTSHWYKLNYVLHLIHTTFAVFKSLIFWTNLSSNLQEDQTLLKVPSLQIRQVVQPFPALQKDQQDQNHHGVHEVHPCQRGQRGQGVQQYPEEEYEWVCVCVSEFV